MMPGKKFPAYFIGEQNRILPKRQSRILPETEVFLLKGLFSLFLCFILFVSPISAFAEEPALDIHAKSAILMEASTGRILYENNIHEPLPPASVTKVMTMLLTMEAIHDGKITMDTVVTASENAKRMGGSTIFLDTGEQMTVHDLLKGIAVASGNDACVAIAEHLAGSEAEFVRQMNDRARALGMENTNFVNCNGLDAPGHVTSAYDIARMSQELLKHEKILEFTTIWVDSLRGGAFGLANTNKLIRFYDGANGLKTGSTDDALYCLSATAKRQDMQLIAVIMGAPTTKDRFNSARALLDYGFANFSLARMSDTDTPVHTARVEKGVQTEVPLRCQQSFSLLLEKSKSGKVETKFEVYEPVLAPVSEGQEAGRVLFLLEGHIVGEVPLVTTRAVAKKSFGTVLCQLLRTWCVA